ncbi:MAG: hypothetical protein WC975_03810 [Phycisphaerae bacterium]
MLSMFLKESKTMKSKLFIIGLMLTCSFNSQPVFAETTVENSTLQKVFKSMTPSINDLGLSATFVRTEYPAQSLKNLSADTKLSPDQTIINDVLVNNQGIKESVRASRKATGLLKEGTFHLSCNENGSRSYDSKNKIGVTSRNSAKNINYLSHILSPDIGTVKSRFISRGKPAFLQKLKTATILEETNQDDSIKLEGEYKNSDPERYFEVTVTPKYNYSITNIVEYDKNKRILTVIVSDNFRSIKNDSSEIWLPQTILQKKYVYDDYRGNTMQMSKLDILDPKFIRVEPSDFVLAFPSGAKVIQDNTLGINFGEVQKMQETATLQAISEMATKTPLSDDKGQELIARTQKKYKQESSTTQNPKTNTSQKEKFFTQNEREIARTLEMPVSTLRYVLTRVICGLLIIVLGGIGFRVYRKKMQFKKTRTSGEVEYVKEV